MVTYINFNRNIKLITYMYVTMSSIYKDCFTQLCFGKLHTLKNNMIMYQ